MNDHAMQEHLQGEVSPNELPPAESPPFLAGGGDLGARVRSFNRRRTPLGPPQDGRAASSCCRVLRLRCR